MRTMHLFAGSGGGLLADRILGHTPLVAVEWEPYPCQVLRERAAEGWFPNLRVWEGDVRMFDPSEYTGQVDCIHAGFPCQDISQAGKQAGIGEGTRSGLYREVLRIAGTVRPRFIFLENVAAIKSNGLEQVVKDLALMGYDTRWLCIRASDVGAPHHRDRWFALCHANTSKSDGGTEQEIKQQGAKESSGDCSGKVGTILAHSKSKFGNGCNDNSRVCMGQQTVSELRNDGWKANVSNSGSTGLEGQWEVSCGVGAKLKDISDTRWWEIEPGVGRVVDGVAHRTHRLKAIGNGQVPLQVAVAFTILAAE